MPEINSGSSTLPIPATTRLLGQRTSSDGGAAVPFSVAELTTQILSGNSFRMTSSGLTLTVGSGRIVDACGVPVSVASGTVLLRDNATSYIVVDLFDLSLHAFSRAIHTAGVCIATVVTSGGVVTSITQPIHFRMGPNPIGAVVSKLRAGGPISVLAIGDSITAGSGGSPAWYNLAFNSANSGAGFNVPNAANVTVNRLGLPGGNSAVAMLAMATVFTSTAGAWDTDHVDQALVGLSGWEASQVPPDSYVGPNKLVSSAPDLVLISLGTNDDGNTYQAVEACARYFRKLGLCVVLATCNRRYDGYSNTAPAGTQWQRIASANGCAIADTAEFMEEAYRNFLHTRIWFILQTLVRRFGRGPSAGFSTPTLRMRR
jgi:lysophospholipase L1-like esterase